jgi:hypothetical protein
MTKSNSERVRLAPANNRFIHGLGRGLGGLARRCCVALLFSAAVLSPPLSAATAPPAMAAAAKPGYLIQAENNYRQARQAVLALEADLKRLNQQKAREGKRALAKYGQWIEPAGLWRKTRAAERNLAFARMHEHHARTELNVARNTARTNRVGGFPKGEFQPSTSWWHW